MSVTNKEKVKEGFKGALGGVLKAAAGKIPIIGDFIAEGVEGAKNAVDKAEMKSDIKELREDTEKLKKQLELQSEEIEKLKEIIEAYGGVIREFAKDAHERKNLEQKQLNKAIIDYDKQMRKIKPKSNRSMSIAG